jgi:hypothetical protein
LRGSIPNLPFKLTQYPGRKASREYFSANSGIASDEVKKTYSKSFWRKKMRVSKLQSFAGGLILLLAILTLNVHGESYNNDSSESPIKIVSPADKSQIDAGEEYPLKYEVTLGVGDDHFHVWVDDTRGPGIHDTKGTYTLPKMDPGTHVITIKIVDKGHVPTGPQKSITLVAK